MKSCSLFLLLAAASAVRAQSVPPPAPEKDVPIQMSSFEVQTTAGDDYSGNGSNGTFKTNEDQMKVPQSMTILTSKFIADTGAIYTSDILQYAGVSNFYQGESLALRGTRINNALIDDFPDTVPYGDPVDIDSLAVIRGPASVLYVNVGLGGAVLKSMKKPLPYYANTVSIATDQYGLFRATVDSTGPVVKLGDGVLEYRVAGAYQDGGTYFDNVERRTVAFTPTFQWRDKNITVRVAWDYQDLHRPSAANDVINPDGSLFTGDGRLEDLLAPGQTEHFHIQNLRAAFLDHLSPNWELRGQFSFQRFYRLAGNLLPSGGVNWQNNTITFTQRRNDQKWHQYFLGFDVSGKYDVFWMPSQTNFGYTYNDYDQWSSLYGLPGYKQTVSIYNPQIDSINVVQPGQYVLPADPWSRDDTSRSNTYFQQTMDVIPNHLIAVAGVSAFFNQDDAYPSGITVSPPTPITVTRIHHILGREGVVVPVVKGIALYALHSTSALPPSAGHEPDGSPLPPQLGIGNEGGVKTELLDGRIGGTISYFRIEQTNQSVFTAVVNGVNTFTPIGTTTQEGWDSSFFVKPLENWQILATFYHGNVETQTGSPVANTYRQSWSLFTRYGIEEGPLKGLSFGGGAARISGRLVSGSGFTLPNGTVPAFVSLKPGTMATAFIGYDLGKHWDFRVTCNNVLNQAYALGAQVAWAIDPSPPRTFGGVITHHF